MSNSNVTFKSVVNATVHVDNSADSEREWQISADVNIQGDSVDNFQNGQLVKSTAPNSVCSFSESRSSFLSLTYSNMENIEDRVAALRAISAFITDVRNSVPSLGLSNADA